MNLIATYISGVHIIRAYNIDDLYHMGRIALLGMIRIVYIVCACIVNYNDLGSSTVINSSKVGFFSVQHFFSA